jgi:hypothetical protein
MDRPGDEPVDRHRLVDGGIEGDADDATDRWRPVASLTARRPRMAASASARVGWASVPPATRVDSDPHATPSRSAASRRLAVDPGREEAASNESPPRSRRRRRRRSRRPGSRCRPSRSRARRRRRTSPRPSAAAAERRREHARGGGPRPRAPVSREASTALGSRTSASAAARANPPSQVPDASQLGSRLVVAPAAWAARNSPGSSAARPGWRK